MGNDEFESAIEKYGLSSNFVSGWWNGEYTWSNVKRLTHGAYLFCSDADVRQELGFLYEIADAHMQMEADNV